MLNDREKGLSLTYTEAVKLKRNDKYPLRTSIKSKKKTGIERVISQFKISSELQKLSFPNSREASAPREVLTGTELILCGRNVCFHGLGSKDEAMARIAKGLEDTHHVFFVRGYYNDFMPRTMYVKLLEYVAGLGGRKRAPEAQGDAEELSLELSGLISCLPEHRFCLVLCGLDGPNFLRPSILAGLARLARQPNFRLAASVDSASLAFHLTRSTADQLDFVYLPINSHRPYARELLYLDSNSRVDLVKKDQATVGKFLSSLTENQKDLVIFVIKELLRTDKKQMEAQELFSRAVAEAKVTSFNQFSENLKEAVTHKILEKKALDGCSQVYKTLYEKFELDETIRFDSDEDSVGALGDIDEDSD